MNKQQLWHNLIYLICITAGVYLSFAYLLPYVFPFLCAYILMRILWPAMNFLHRRCHLPRLISHYGTLFLFFVAIGAGVFWLASKLISQLRLLLANFPFYRDLIEASFSRQADSVCSGIDYYLHLEQGTSGLILTRQIMRINQNISNHFADQIGPALMSCVSAWLRIAVVLFIVGISMFILIKELEPINRRYKESRYYQHMHFILSHIKKSGLAYLRTEGIILLINWAICSLGLFLVHNSYFFIFGMAISLIDAFPILGSGMVLAPMGIYYFISGNYLYAATILTAYLLTLLVREFLEAKLLGEGMGLNPFFMLASIFIGLQIFGVTGIILGPLAVVTIRSLYMLIPGR